MQSITVIGLGYVGLPVACAFARAGAKVYGADIDPDIINKLKTRTFDYTEPMLNDILAQTLDKTLFVSQTVTPADVYIITVQTPVRADRTADNSYVENALKSLSGIVKSGDLVILESTVPVGSNEMFYAALKSGSAADISYCYCPESILPGNIFAEIKTNPRVIGGRTQADALRAKRVYDIINVGEKSITDIATAEFVKLVQNAHRDVELAFVNELSVMCDVEGVDAFKVIEIAKNHPRCNLLSPGSGVGGHCIAVDPYFLIERFGDKASLCAAARAVNNGKPVYIADKAIAMLGGDAGKTVGVLGLSYKADCEDCRESSGIAICRRLAEKGFNVLANEVNSQRPVICGIKNESIETVLQGSDLVIIAQKHTAYRGLTFCRPVIDCVGLLTSL